MNAQSTAIPVFFLSSSIDFWDGQHLDSSLNGTQARGAPMNLLGIQMKVMQIWGSMLNFRACWISINITYNMCLLYFTLPAPAISDNWMHDHRC